MDIYNDINFYGIDRDSGFKKAKNDMLENMPDQLMKYPKNIHDESHVIIDSVLFELYNSLYGLDNATRRSYNRVGNDHVKDSKILFNEIKCYLDKETYKRFKPIMDNITRFIGVPNTFTEYSLLYCEIERKVDDDILFAVYELFYDQFLVDTYAVFSEFLYSLENLSSFSDILFDSKIDQELMTDSPEAIQVSAILMYAKSFFSKKFNAIEVSSSYKSIYNMYLNHKKRYELLHSNR